MNKGLVLKALSVIVWQMLCEKIHTQLPSADSAGKSEGYLGLERNSAQPSETASSVADQEKRTLTQAERQKRWRQKHPEKSKRQKRRHYWRHRERMILKRKENYRRQHGPAKKIHGRTIAEKLAREAECASNRVALILSNPETAKEYRAKKKASMAKWLECLRASPVRLAEFNKKASARKRIRLRENPEARAKAIAATRAWQDANWDRLMDYQTERYNSNPQVNMAQRARNGVRRALRCGGRSTSDRQRARCGGLKRTCRTADLLGCSWPDFLLHIERQFLPGMTWSNMQLWQIDHIVPLSKWTLTDPEQLKAACNFNNLAPLWAEENARKGNRHSERVILNACPIAHEVAQSAP